MSFLVGFFSLPLLVIYGWFSPWPQAEQKFDAEGIKGSKFLVGTSAHYEYSPDERLAKHTREYLVLPASLPKLELFDYMETTSSNATGIKQEISGDSFGFFVTALMWLLSGCFSAWTVRSWLHRRRNGPRAG
ncbi:MAG TPA: hypothetical protein VG733_01935 [Chthoniobacteraceae bacterium]|nr:hypothetical protein [Chthoniobacteraceae bacterium]